MQNYSTIIGVIALRLAGESYEVTQKRYHVGSSTVTLIMKRFRETNLSLDDLRSMPPQTVEDTFYPPDNLRKEQKPLPDFETVHTRMMQMKHPDLSLLWLEYKQAHPDGYQLAWFYKLYADYVTSHYGSEKVSMPVERVPGERMYIDWVGDQPAILLDSATGELKKVHVFITTLGFSSCIYAEVFPNEKASSFLTGVTNALQFYGAVPKYLVPDNLKAAVTKHSRDELVLNTAFADLEEFYGVIVLPPPARKPKGKPTVENHVRLLETRLLEKLQEDTYTSLEAIQTRTREIVARINQEAFQKRSDVRKTRLQAFQAYDKPRMRHLPGNAFTVCDYRFFAKVPNNYHLEYDGHYYSVPFSYYGKPAMLKATPHEIRISDANNQLICTHPRSYKEFPRYITTDDHMPANHQYYKELGQHDGNYYRRWAASYGEAMATVIDRVLRSAIHEEQAYNSCNGMLHLCDDVPHALVDEAAQNCLDRNACRYTYFKKVLRELHQSPCRDGNRGCLPENENVRGRDSYQ